MTDNNEQATDNRFDAIFDTIFESASIKPKLFRLEDEDGVTYINLVAVTIVQETETGLSLGVGAQAGSINGEDNVARFFEQWNIV